MGGLGLGSGRTGTLNMLTMVNYLLCSLETSLIAGLIYVGRGVGG